MSNDSPSVVSIGKIDISPDKMEVKFNTDDLPLLPTRDMVLFPGVPVPISLGRETARIVAQAAHEGSLAIGIVCQRNPEEDAPGLDDLYRFGVAAKVMQIFDLPDGSQMAFVHGFMKFRILGPGPGAILPQAPLSAQVKEIRETAPRKGDKEYDSLVQAIQQTTRKLIENSGPAQADLQFNLTGVTDGVMLVNMVSTHSPFPVEVKMELLAESRVKERAFKLMSALSRDEQKSAMLKEILERTKSMLDTQQRKSVLRAQLDTIKEELYGPEDEEIAALREKAAATDLPEAVRRTFDKELEKLERCQSQSPEYGVQHSYLTTLLSLPWGVADPVNTDFNKAEEILDSEHYGLEKVKERILEQIAVVMNAPESRSPILCLVGAPGVGKTSLGASIARAMGRKYERVALGGLHDEAEIRGHRRTYIGAMPGRIVTALRRAETANPVMLLDEIDKIGSDFRGDPSAALLEVLDPEQNFRFHDNYVDVDFDLSKVLFIATANTLGSIAQPLLDRMEVIDISGYLLEEKIQIAHRHLLPRLCQAAGIEPGSIDIPDDTIAAIVEQYTSESGVRQLEKRLAAMLRKAVLHKMRNGEMPRSIGVSDLTAFLGVAPYIKDRYEGNSFIGVVTGLAWTQAGGEILYIESSLSNGKAERPTLTGNLGDVMKESAVIAHQYIKAHAADLGIEDAVCEKPLHIHVPEGAIPKDGPSAGITMATSIASAMTGRKVRERIAMTGEITLRGKVLPVGGIKEKILAAKRAGIDTIVLSSANRKDVDDIKEDYRQGLAFVYVDTVAEVLDFALLPL